MPTTPDQTRVALYARVSSDQQAEAGTIASQVAALRGRIAPATAWPWSRSCVPRRGLQRQHV